MAFEKLENTGRYFDAMNFATRAQAQCDALVGVGLVDVTCPAEGVFATTNQLKGKTQTIIMPRSGHGGEGPGHKAYYEVFWRFLESHK